MLLQKVDDQRHDLLGIDDRFEVPCREFDVSASGDGGRDFLCPRCERIGILPEPYDEARQEWQTGDSEGNVLNHPSACCRERPGCCQYRLCRILDLLAFAQQPCRRDIVQLRILA